MAPDHGRRRCSRHLARISTPTFFNNALLASAVPLRVHNVRTRQKEPFLPIQEDHVGFYLCGLTVYDHMHIGHARTAVSFEVIRRWLEHHYGDGNVRFVQNVTDVDDKIINRARDLGVSPLEHAATWDRECRLQSDRLGVRPPDVAPHATTSMPGIIAYVEGIIEQGFAYATEEGNVYFDVPKYDEHAQTAFPGMGYGTLSRRDYREMAAGTRKDVEGDKRHPADFALWKAAKPDEPEDARWDSPWGKGRPGWHIECSHMSTHSLGVDDPDDPHYGQIDFHGGGQDLIFPHHENEIAQTQARTGKAPFVNFWVHTGFLNVEGQKMSKSLGNFITLKQLLDELEAEGHDPEGLRLYFVQTHYASKIDFSRKGLAEAIVAMQRLRRTRETLHEAMHRQAAPDDAVPDADRTMLEAATKLEKDFAAAMDDDFHTPGALAAIFTFQRAANAAAERGLGSHAAKQVLGSLERCARVLTLFADELALPGDGAVPESLVPLLKDIGVPVATERETLPLVLEARQRARADKDWATSDRIRDQLAAAGYVIEDTAQGARWRKAD